MFWAGLYVKICKKWPKFAQKIIKIDSKKSNKIYNQIKNEYFLSSGNKENLSFVLKILKIFKLNNKILLKTLNKFKGLKYRQQIIYENQNLIIINDSKSTSFASSENLLKNLLVQTQAIGNISKDVLIRKTPRKLRRLNTNFSIIERQDHPKLRELLSQCQATTTSSLPKLIASKGSRMLTQTSPTLVGGKDDSLSTAMTQKPFITQLSS